MGFEFNGLDEKDLKILEELRKNSRISYTELAKIVELSDVAVIKRIKKLEEKGVIRGYTIIVDPRKIGYRHICITGINVKPQQMFPIISELRSIENIQYLALTTGDHHIIAIIWARDQDELDQIHRRIKEIPGVENVYPSIITDDLKGPICL